MKSFEYLAAGCPVVATNIRSPLPYRDLVSLVDPIPTAFSEAVQSELSVDTAEMRSQRSQYASTQTYHQRTRAMLDLIEQSSQG